MQVPVAGAPPPHEAHRRLARRHATTFVLESREGPERLARYSFVGFSPAGTVRYDRSGLTVTGALPGPSRDQAPLEYLRRIQAFYAVPAGDAGDTAVGPFVGGLVGSVGYAFARHLEPVLDRQASPQSPVLDADDDGAISPDPRDDGSGPAWPRFLFGLYLDGLVYDHRDGSVRYVSRGEDRHEALLEALAEGPQDEAGEQPETLAVGPLTATTDRAVFEDQVRRAQALIRDGEAFQIVLSRAYEADHEGTLSSLYAWLRDAAAVPYLFYLRFDGGLQLLGASPEMLVRVRAQRCETFPIAGTRPLTGDEAADRAAASDLAADRKETAEHAMLVDLARNDLSRVCRPGTVRVASFQEVERFRSVQHLVSRVVGELDAGRDALDALAAVFPAGTVSGAPKVRAMEHIHTIEGRERGPYAGAVAYISFNGDFDSAIAIRSLSAHGARLTVQAGAGIVIRSDPTSEFHETRHKAGTLLEGLAHFGATLPAEEDDAVDGADAAGHATEVTT